MQALVAILTLIVLTGYGFVLNWLWNAGYWYIPALSFPGAMLVAYVFSSPEDRQTFKASCARQAAKLLRR